MKSINVKRVAAVAAGAALTVGALAGAFAATSVSDVSWDKGFFWDAQGNTNVQIVLGGTSAPSDGVNAGRLAGVIGSKAFVQTSGGQSVAVSGADIGATGEVVVTTGGGTISVTGIGDTIDMEPAATSPENTLYQANDDSEWILSSSNAPFLKGGTITMEDETTTADTDDTEDYSYEELIKIDGENALKFEYDENEDVAGYFFTGGGKDDVTYLLDFDEGVPQNTDVDGAPVLWFLGEQWLVNDWDLDGNGIELIKGEEVRLGVGQSRDLTIDGTIYTVTLNDASLDETGGQDIGEAALAITVAGSTTEVNLDTRTAESRTVGDLFIFLSSVAKSYTPGQGGTATFRIGGESLLLDQGQPLQTLKGEILDDDYQVEFGTSTVSSVTVLNELRLQYDVSMNLDDEVTSISGPMGYFVVKFAGTEDVKWQEITVESSNDRLDTVSYVDKEGQTNTFEVVDTSDSEVITHFVETGENGTVHRLVVIGKDEDNDEAFIHGDEVVTFVTADTTPDSQNTTGSVSVTLRTEGSSVKVFPTAIDNYRALAYFDGVTVAGRAVDLVLGLLGSDENDLWDGVDNRFPTAAGTGGGMMELEDATSNGNTINDAFNGTEPQAGGIHADFYVDVGNDGQGSGDAEGWAVFDIDTAADNIPRNTTYEADPDDGGPKYLDTQYASDFLTVVPEAGVTLDITAANEDNTTLFIQEEEGGVQFGIYFDSSGDDEGLVVIADSAAIVDYTLRDASDTVIDLAKSDVDKNDKNHISAYGTQIFDASSTALTLNYPDDNIELTFFAGQETGTTEELPEGSAAYTPDNFASPVSAFTCAANDYSYTSAAGVTFGNVADDLVVLDSTQPRGNALVLGGHMVNSMANTQGQLNAAGDRYVDLTGSTATVAGYGAADTTALVNDLLAALRAM